VNPGENVDNRRGKCGKPPLSTEEGALFFKNNENK
jgi:hypothetical protein